MALRPGDGHRDGNLRIAVLLHSLEPGGSQQRMVWFINRFVELGHSVDLLLISSRGQLRSSLDERVRVRILAGERGKAIGPSSWLTALAIARFMRSAAPDVLLSGVNWTHALAIRARALSRRSAPVALRLCSKPKLWPRGLSFASIPRRLWGRSEELYGKADALIAVSHSTGEDFRKIRSIANRTISVIYNATATRDLLARPVAAKTSNDPPVILGIGRFQKVKDFATLIRAIAMIREQRPVKLILLGDGPERADLAQLVGQLGLTAAVEFPGWTDAVAEWIERADVVVSSSIYEGLPGALIEALALGRPVVATDCPGGSREILADGAFGTLVPVRDPAAMASAILRSLDSAADPQRLRAGASRFGEEGKAEAYIELFRSLRSGGSGLHGR